MQWTGLFFALLVAIVVTAIVIGVAGWRRPGAHTDEGILWSAVFVFLILFFGVWAASLWMAPWGALAWDTAWIGLLAVAFILALIMLAAAPRRPPALRADANQAAEAAAVGFGLVFWILLLVLIGAVIAGMVR